MDGKEFNDILNELYKYETLEQKTQYLKTRYDEMCKKYGNQFKNNGVIDEFINLLNKFHIGEK